MPTKEEVKKAYRNLNSLIRILTGSIKDKKDEQHY